MLSKNMIPNIHSLDIFVCNWKTIDLELLVILIVGRRMIVISIQI